MAAVVIPKLKVVVLLPEHQGQRKQAQAFGKIDAFENTDVRCHCINAVAVVTC